MNCKKTNEKACVVVTGFGIFHDYKFNPSWEAVKLIELPNVNLIKKEIKVTYDEVDNILPKIWQQYDPSLMIHVGVSCLAKGIVLESCAHSLGYCGLDVNKCTPVSFKSKLANEDECIYSKLDIENLCNYLNEEKKSGNLKLNASISTNAGRYLCEYIYYTSLKFNRHKTLFVHVPDPDKFDFTIEDIKNELEFILMFLIENLHK